MVPGRRRDTLRPMAPDQSPQYFAREPAVASRPGSVQLTLPDLSATLTVDRGVFSGGRVDPGTVALLRAVTDVASEGHLLDLGCGYGPIAVTLATRARGATVWAVDVNTRAVDLTRRNAEALGLGNVRAVAPEEVPDDVTFAQLWSNPPIRIGKDALHELLLRWLPRLAPDGRAWLVVHHHLGGDSLARWLGDQGWDVVRHGSKQGYRILGVRPRP